MVPYATMKATDLRGILGYMVRFRDRLFVLNIDSAVLAADAYRTLLLDISVLRSLNINVLIVHGASRRIAVLADQLGQPASDLDGLGITDTATLELAVLAAYRFAHDILQGLAESDVRAAVTNAVVAHPAGIRGGRDFQHTGKVERVDTPFLHQLLKEGVVPVIPPVGMDGNGRSYRVNSDQVALAVAQALNADKLMYITTHNGIAEAGALSAQFSIEEAKTCLYKRGAQWTPEMRSQWEHGLRACEQGVQRVHFINGLQDEALLGEVFSNEGVGTMIYANEYQSIRPARKRDTGIILRLIREAVSAEELVARTRREINEQLGHFYVFEIDRNVVACAGLRTYAAEGIAELHCLFVAAAHENQGIGSKLIEYCAERARALGCRRLLALSTQAFNYFKYKGGFTEGQLDDLPAARQAAYVQQGRQSQILIKEL